MKRIPVWRIGLVVLTIITSILLLRQTFAYYRLSLEDRMESPEMRSAQASMSDLETQVQELYDKISAAREADEPADTIAALEKDYNQKRDDFDKARKQFEDAHKALQEMRSKAIRLGLDLRGGVHVVLEVDRDSAFANYKDLLENSGEDAAIQRALESAEVVVRQRVDGLGVAEPVIQTQPPNRIIVEIPGYSRPEEVSDILRTEAQLEFNLLADYDEAELLIDDISNRAAADLNSLLKQRSQQAISEFFVSDIDYRVVDSAINSRAAKDILSDEYKFAWSKEENDPVYGRIRKLYLLNAKVELSGSYLQNAYADFDTSGLRETTVVLFFNATGKDLLSRLTKLNVGKHMAIVLDNIVYMAPVIKTHIPNGVASIEGGMSREEASNLAIVLRSGALPAKLNIAENRVVGPSLGHDSVVQGVQSAVVGLIVVVIFMVIYYAWAGVIADIALVFNFLFLMAILAYFGATLTLPGIAGAVLILGMAVDANVLIYERIREELVNMRVKTLKAVIDKGYNRAFLTIFDSNVTTLLTAIVLFRFGTGPLRGFAVTLMWGIIISMFTALFITRLIFDLSLDNMDIKNLSVGKLAVLKNMAFNFTDNFKWPVVGSISVIAIGLISIIAHGGLNAGIDFSGGTLVRVGFSEPVSEDTIRSVLQTAGVDTGSLLIQRVSDAEVPGTEFHLKTKLDPEAGAEQHEQAQKMVAALDAGLPNIKVEERSIDQVGAAVGHDLAMQGFWCVVFGSLLILAYITIRFELRYAVAAVIALVHDVLITISLFSLFNWEFNLPIIAALLTIVGYSLNDTIVVYDRIRENYTSAVLNLRTVINKSINETLSRTVITGLTTFFVVVVMLVFGGEILRLFMAALCIGVVVGTYSSIFIAAPLLIFWKKRTRRESMAKA